MKAFNYFKWPSIYTYISVSFTYTTGDKITALKYFFLLSFNPLIGWQLCIWNCCKPFFSLLSVSSCVSQILSVCNICYVVSWIESYSIDQNAPLYRNMCIIIPLMFHFSSVTLHCTLHYFILHYGVLV
jgi:hypothetical protein